LEAEGVKVESQEVSLRDFLDDLRSHYQIPLGKELTLTWDYPSDLPVVKTDSEKLKHILENLVNNAIKFTEKGTITVSARYFNGARAGESSRKQEKGDSQDGVVELKVSDTGVGIAKGHFPVIFERFRQVDSSETRRYGGVGIGLYIVKKFTELLGGKVEVESEVGKGSIFTVTIPWKK
jgi:signal transduction histidine kinase